MATLESSSRSPGTPSSRASASRCCSWCWWSQASWWCSATPSALHPRGRQPDVVDIGFRRSSSRGAVLAAFVATNVLTREIDNRTVLTVAEPSARPIFVLGSTSEWPAQVAVMVFLALLFMLVEIRGPPDGHRPLAPPVITLGTGASCSAPRPVSGATSSTAGSSRAPSSCSPPPFWPSRTGSASCWVPISPRSPSPRRSTASSARRVGPLHRRARPDGPGPGGSTRLGQVLTLVTTVGLFVLGLLDWLFGRRIGRLDTTILELRDAGIAIDPRCLPSTGRSRPPTRSCRTSTGSRTPSPGSPIPASYVASAVPYGLSLTVVALAIAIVLFQRREVADRRGPANAQATGPDSLHCSTWADRRFPVSRKPTING